jgi:HK97 family phage major capsid protein
MELEKMIQDGLSEVKNLVTEKTKGIEGIEAKAASLVADLETKMQTANEAKIVELKSEFEGRIDALVADMKSKKTENKRETKSFAGEFAKTLSEKEAEVKGIVAGQKLVMELKDVAIETNNTLTGEANGDGGAVINQNGSVILPSPLVNFSSLVRTVSGSGDTIRLWREDATTNAVNTVAKGNAKPTQLFDIPPVDFTATYRAAIYRFHKSMVRNLPWMQARLPQMLIRNYYKFENALFYGELQTAATPATGTGEGVIALVEAIAQLESADFAPSGIVLNPIDWANISVTRDDDNGFSLPGTVTFIGGQLTINGVPVFKATFVPAGEYIVGDWSQAYKYTTDGLKVELFEQDVDNVQKNAITARVEESNVLVIEQPLAFVTGELSQEAGEGEA